MCIRDRLKTACFDSGYVPIDEFQSLLDLFALHFATEERIADEAGLDFTHHAGVHGDTPVSYTHLDVYKRQAITPRALWSRWPSTSRCASEPKTGNHLGAALFGHAFEAKKWSISAC